MYAVCLESNTLLCYSLKLMFWLELKQKLENLAYRNLTRAMLSFLLIGEVFFISVYRHLDTRSFF